MKGLQVLLAAVVTALVVMPIAIAGADGGATASATSSAKQLKALKRQSLTLARQVAALTAKVDSLESKQDPTTLPPSGAAGGDLSGSFPNPQIGADAVGSQEIVNSAVTSTDVADGAIGSPDIADGSIGTIDIGDETIGASDIATGAVRASEILDGNVQARALGLVQVVSGAVSVPAGVPTTAAVNCPEGFRLLSGGFEWNSQKNDTTMIQNSPTFTGEAARTWEVRGVSASAGKKLFAEALCLK